MEENLPTTLAQALQEITALRSELRKTKGHINVLLSDMETGGQETAALKRQVTDRDNEITRLQRQIDYAALGLPVHRPQGHEVIVFPSCLACWSN